MSITFKQYHPVKTGLAVLFMLLFLACIGLLAWASHKGATVHGPIHIAANAARVCVTLNDEILVLDTHGALQERYTLDAVPGEFLLKLQPGVGTGRRNAFPTRSCLAEQVA